jgi:hypothetical protein
MVLLAYAGAGGSIVARSRAGDGSSAGKRLIWRHTRSTISRAPREANHRKTVRRFGIPGRWQIARKGSPLAIEGRPRPRGRRPRLELTLRI